MNRGFIGALILSMAFALLAGCGGSQPPVGAPGPASDHEHSLPSHQTFKYVGKKQLFKVPVGVTQLQVILRGAGGGGTNGGRGGRVSATIAVTPYESLFVFVGGTGKNTTGGFNGGGHSPKNVWSYGFGGGGASDIREGGDMLSNRVVVAGGGGGDGAPSFYYINKEMAGGKGGGLIAGNGSGGGSDYREYGDGGDGGTQNSGGDGGPGASGCATYLAAPGKNGTLGRGGHGGGAYPSRHHYAGGGGGGGGGGGYYGGGGGGSGCVEYPVVTGGGGGGGGSSYAESTVSDVHMWRGWKNATGDGLVVISW